MAEVLDMAPRQTWQGLPGPKIVNPRLSVIIVNYRQWPNTARLVGKLAAAPPFRREEVEMVVVDNHSPPHRLIGRLRRRPGVSLRRWGRNRGFARAANEGCRLARGNWFLLLNPDVGLGPEFLQGALDLADQLEANEPRVGIVGFRLRHADGSPQFSTGSFPTLIGTLAGLVFPRHRRKYRTFIPSERCRVPWVTGCCLLLRRECLKDLGGLDERFFLYYEDVDLCRRAHERGWTVWYEPRLEAVHLLPLHTRAVPPPLRLVLRHSLLTYAARHWPGWQFRFLARIIRLEARLRRLWADWRGDHHAANLFQEMEATTAELAGGRDKAASRRLMQVVKEM